MLMRRLVPCVLLGGLLWPTARSADAQTAPGQLAYVEQNVVNYQPVQQRVIVPVQQYRTVNRLEGWWNPFGQAHWVQRQVPVTRWEERIQTSYVPVTQRQYRPVIETSMRQLPPLQLATRPRAAQAIPSGGRLYDDLPMVAITSPPPVAQTAQTPRTTLAPQTFKPAARAPVGTPGSPASNERKPGDRTSTWSR